MIIQCNYNNIIKFFQDNMIAKIILDAYLALIIVSLLIFLAVVSDEKTIKTYSIYIYSFVSEC